MVAAAAAQLSTPSVATTSNTFGAQALNVGGFGAGQSTGNTLFETTNTSAFGGTSTIIGSTTPTSSCFRAQATSCFGSFDRLYFHAQPAAPSGEFGAS